MGKKQHRRGKSVSIIAAQLAAIEQYMEETMPEQNRYFITDLEASAKAIDPATDQVVLEIPRYGVWDEPAGNVVETSNDLKYLKTKYNTDVVYSIRRHTA